MPWRVKCNKQTQKYALAPCGDPCGGDPCDEAGTGVTQTQSRQIEGEGARAGQGDSAKGGKRRMGLATTWGVLTYYFLYYTHTTCSLTKRYPFVNLFSCVSARSAKNTFPRIKSVLRLRCWWGPVRRWLAAFSESDGLTFDRRPALVCVTSIEGHLPAACLNTRSVMDTSRQHSRRMVPAIAYQHHLTA